MPVLTGDGHSRRFTSYGKRRVNVGSTHRDWLASVHSGDSTSTSSGIMMTSTPVTLEDYTSPTLKVAGLSKLMPAATPIEQHHQLHRQSAEPDKENHPPPIPRQRKVANPADGARAGKSSSTSRDSAESDEVLIKPPKKKAGASTKNRRAFVVDSPDPKSSKSPPPPPVSRPPLLDRKNTSSLPLTSSSPVKSSQASSKSEAKCVHAHAYSYCFCSRPPPILPISPVKPATTFTPFPAVAAPQTGNKKSSAVSSSSLALPPPRGHGVQATAAWRKPLPLTPIVIAGQGRFGFVKPKRPPKEREQASPTRRVKERKRTESVEVVVEVQAKPSVKREIIDLTDERELTHRETTAPIKKKEISPSTLPSAVITRGEPKPLSSASASSATKAALVVAQTPPQTPQTPRLSTLPISPEFGPLLQACTIPALQPYDFTSFIRHFPLLLSGTRWTKLGEATYSEVFVASSANATSELGGEETIVVKVIPLHMPDKDNQANGSIETPQTSLCKDVAREVEITKMLAEDGTDTGYPGLRGTYVVQGPYPAPLLEAWTTYKKASKNAENVRPDTFPDNQLYALVCLSHGGQDLETVKLKSWSEAASVLWQVALSLSQAEEKLQFEHRDLHWGNILVRPCSDEVQSKASSHDAVQPAALGPAPAIVQATVIDFTLSRVTLESGKILAGGFEDDAIFDGEGEYQYDCYRIMKELVQDRWESYRPVTNVVWLHYLARKLLFDKRLKKPSSRSKATAMPGTPRSVPRGARSRGAGTPAKSKSRSKPAEVSPEERLAYEALAQVEFVLEKAVDIALEAVRPDAQGVRTRSGKSSAGTIASVSSSAPIRSAGEFVNWWVWKEA